MFLGLPRNIWPVQAVTIWVAFIILSKALILEIIIHKSVDEMYGLTSIPCLPTNYNRDAGYS